MRLCFGAAAILLCLGACSSVGESEQQDQDARESKPASMSEMDVLDADGMACAGYEYKLKTEPFGGTFEASASSLDGGGDCRLVIACQLDGARFDAELSRFREDTDLADEMVGYISNAVTLEDEGWLGSDEMMVCRVGRPSAQGSVPTLAQALDLSGMACAGEDGTKLVMAPLDGRYRAGLVNSPSAGDCDMLVRCDVEFGEVTMPLANFSPHYDLSDRMIGYIGNGSLDPDSWLADDELMKCRLRF